MQASQICRSQLLQIGNLPFWIISLRSFVLDVSGYKTCNVSWLTERETTYETIENNQQQKTIILLIIERGYQTYVYWILKT